MIKKRGRMRKLKHLDGMESGFYLPEGSDYWRVFVFDKMTNFRSTVLINKKNEFISHRLRKTEKGLLQRAAMERSLSGHWVPEFKFDEEDESLWEKKM